jgi:hypothetical protein
MLARDWLWLVVVVVLAGGWFLTAQSKAQLEARYQALVRQQATVAEP